MVMGYRLGIDLGTTFTSAAVYSDGWPTMVPLGRHAMQVPSVLFLTPEHEFLVGEAAEQRGAADPHRMAREFKRRLGDQVPILVAGSPHSAHALQARLLSWVVAEVTRIQGSAPDHVTLTYPANWGPYKQELFAQTVRMADLSGVDTCTEPEAAAALYAARTVMAEGDCVAVYDLGGGTFDVAVLRKTSSGFTILGHPDGLEHLGGIDFDEAVFRHVVGQLGDLAGSAEADDADVLAALARLRRDCVAAKEALSSDTEAVVQVALPAQSTSVRLTRDELEDMIRPAVADTIAATRRALRSAGVEAADLTAIVLTGGSSRIPLVSQQLTEAFGRPLALDTHPKHDVALGAALHGVAVPVPSPERATGAVPQTAAEPAGAEPSAAETPGPAAPVAPPSRPAKPRRPPREGARIPRRPLVAGLAVLVSAAAVATGLYVATNLGGGNDAAAGEGATSTPTSPASPSTPPPTSQPPTTPTPIVLPVSTLLVSAPGKGGQARILQVDVDKPSQPAKTVPIRGLPSGARAWLPTISPDRTTVVFLVGSKPSDGSLVPWISADGGPANPLLDAGSPCRTTGRPSFSPDGNSLAVICLDRDTRKSSLLVLDLAGQLVGSPLVIDGTPDGNPTWTNDGRIIFQRRIGSDPEKLWSVPDGASGATPQRVTLTATGWDSHEDWSNVSGRLLFLRTTGDGGGGVIYVSDDSGGFRPLPGVQNAQAPSWSPDGRRIAFLRKIAKRPTLWVMNADGSNLHRIDLPHVKPGAPAWDSR